MGTPQVGQFVSARGRLWLVEPPEPSKPFQAITLACVDDDAQGETARVLWDAEVDASLRDEEAWTNLGAQGWDDARAFAAYLRTIKWKTATAAERDLFQAPFRAGIRLDPYQLLPLRKALRLPRVNMLIADDVGLGKTVEAGLIVRELLLRRRIDLVVVAAPAAMTLQWQDELASKFGLNFEIIDRQHVEALRRTRGFGVNPWAAGSRFILSHKLISDEAYVGGLRDVLGDFRARSLLILDEAHHAAPAGGGRYAIESQFTRDLRDLASRFEHRLFLSATPHNGHPNSFATLLELLDAQRFTRGMAIKPADLEPVMVRRLKADLRALGETFPERVVETVRIEGLDETSPELRLATMFADYRELRERRIGALSGAKAARARLAIVGLQQRLLSSVPAFANTLRKHVETIDRLIAGASDLSDVATDIQEEIEVEAAEVAGIEDEATALDLLDRAEERAVQMLATAGALDADRRALEAERTAAAAMLEIADTAKGRPDARVRWLEAWIRENLIRPDGTWSNRRLIVFSEWEDTRRYLVHQLDALLSNVLSDDPNGDARIESFSGITSTERREAIKSAFNDADSPLRILLCTDAAREGINLQSQCYDLVHFDLPWNPSRLEQRNGRIDRKLQPSPQVFCRYFIYAQRPEDMVLDALVRKTEIIRRELGSAGQVLENRIARRLGDVGIARGEAQSIADRIRDEEADEQVRAAVRDLDDAPDARMERLKREQEELSKALEEARKRVGVDSNELEEVVGLALSRAGGDWNGAQAQSVGRVPTFELDPAQPVFSKDPSWQPLFDELRERRKKPGEKPGEWRASSDARVRRISFAPAIEPDGRDAGDVVQVHLEHRLVRRLLSRFLSAGFQSELARATVIKSSAAAAGPRVVLVGRLALYGEGAARLHEEVLTVTAAWRERGEGEALRAYAGEGAADARVIEELIESLHDAESPDEAIVKRATSSAVIDVRDLRPVLEERAAERAERAARELAQRGEAEAKGLENLLKGQITKIRAEEAKDDRQFVLVLDQAEVRQREADRRSWQAKVARLEAELEREPARLRASYDVRATRIEPVGIIWLWPEQVA